MGTIGTFDSFTAARLGIYAAMQGLQVTGNNISNINTEGYTRQRIDQVSLKTGAGDMYRSLYDNHIGNGALVTGINQIRDPYLDIRFRNTSAEVGYKEGWLSGLDGIASILDEVGKGENDGDGLLYAQLVDLGKALRALDADPNKDNDTLVRSSASALVGLFNTYAGRLENLRQNTIASFKQDVVSVNEILTNIRNLNESIRNCDIHGDSALEMRDERNRQIDALAKYMKINVVYSMEQIGAGQEVEKLTISLGNANPDSNVTTDSSMLIDGIFGSQISIIQVPQPNPNFDSNLPIGGTNLPYLDNEGRPVENEEDAALIDNSNYDLHISKLYDSKGRQWSDPFTSIREVEGTKVDAPAVFKFQVKNGSTRWSAGDPDADPAVPADTFDVAGTTYTIGTDISAADANNPEKLAAFIAEKLQAAGNADYTITSEGAYIVYTAKAAGEKQDGEKPSLTVTNGSNKVSLGSMVTSNPGYTTVAPAQDSVTRAPDGSSKTEVSYLQSKGKWYEVTTVTSYSKEIDLDDNDLYGSLQAKREMLTEAGEFATQDTVANVDENAAIKRGIPYYQKSLDLLALQLATQYNSLNHGFMVNQNGDYINEDGGPLQLAGQPISKTNGLTAEQKQALIDDGCTLPDGTPDLDRWLAANNAKTPEGMGVLFSNQGDGDLTDGITAANISVSHSWSTGDVKVIPTYVQLFGENGEPITNTTQSENVGHMLSRIEDELLYDPRDLVPDAVGTKLFVGNFNNMFNNMMTVEGNDARINTVDYNNDYTSMVEIDSNRMGVSGVDLNDEAMNMMQFQKAYSAACRMMTAIDEVLDRLINYTAV